MIAGVRSTGMQIDINGASLYVEEQGAGESLVLVHAGLLSSVSWASLVPVLAEQLRVITFDCRGHGRSTNNNGELRFEQLADDTADLIAALGIDRPIVGGWSNGGEVALQVGLRHPGLARALIVGGIAFDYGSEAVGGSEAVRAKLRAVFHIDDGVADFDAFAADAAQTLLPVLRQNHPGGDAQLRALVQSVTHWLSYEGLTCDLVSRLETPTLVVVGDRDEFVPVEQAVKLYRCLPQAELAILPGSTHMRPVFDPKTLAPAVLDFLHRH